jgi:hypothetical protein
VQINDGGWLGKLKQLGVFNSEHNMQEEQKQTLQSNKYCMMLQSRTLEISANFIIGEI